MCLKRRGGGGRQKHRDRYIVETDRQKERKKWGDSRQDIWMLNIPGREKKM